MVLGSSMRRRGFLGFGFRFGGQQFFERRQEGLAQIVGQVETGNPLFQTGDNGGAAVLVFTGRHDIGGRFKLFGQPHQQPENQLVVFLEKVGARQVHQETQTHRLIGDRLQQLLQGNRRRQVLVPVAQHALGP